VYLGVTPNRSNLPLSTQDTFPPQLWFWISSSVKKSSGLPKRLWRLCEVWLFESKDWSAFQKKAQALVVDYVLNKKK
jgi:hypothetical protein